MIHINPNDWYIVRTQASGAFFGHILSKDGKEVELVNSRRIWYWAGAATISELAVYGTTDPEKCRFPTEVGYTILTEVVEIIKCTDEAVASLQSVPVWSAKTIWVNNV